MPIVSDAVTTPRNGVKNTSNITSVSVIKAQIHQITLSLLATADIGLGSSLLDHFHRQNVDYKCKNNCLSCTRTSHHSDMLV